ncbi:MAG: hypothetical protein K2H84_08285 [Paramuribaculum sp.]|nr:hypothetical protein [Paramuribaculum sp.]
MADNTENLNKPDVRALIDRAEKEAYRKGFNAAASAHIQRQHGIWAPAPRVPDESEVAMGDDSIECRVPGACDA